MAYCAYESYIVRAAACCSAVDVGNPIGHFVATASAGCSTRRMMSVEERVAAHLHRLARSSHLLVADLLHFVPRAACARSATTCLTDFVLSAATYDNRCCSSLCACIC